jgi:non-homologous end joining protein Ku
MSDRASAKTTLAFGLLDCPISLHKTWGENKSGKLDTAAPSGARLAEAKLAAVVSSDPIAGTDATTSESAVEYTRALVDEQTGEHVAPSEVRRGIRHEDGSFTDLTEGLEKIAEATKLDEMRVAGFVRVQEVARERIIGSYYVAPDGPGAPKVVRLLYEAMRETQRVAAVKWTKRTKQSVGVLLPYPATKALMLVELTWAEDCRPAPSRAFTPAQAEVSEEEIAGAVELVMAMADRRSAALDTLTDDARRMRQDLIERAEAGEPFEVLARPKRPAGGDLEKLLRESLAPDVLAA